MDTKEWVKAQCVNGHLYGNGKEVIFDDKCPYCKSELAGFVERRIVTVDQAKAKGWVISEGLA